MFAQTTSKNVGTDISIVLGDGVSTEAKWPTEGYLARNVTVTNQ